MDEEQQYTIACPSCTFLNQETNTLCTICNTRLMPGNIPSNNIEEKFMSITGTNGMLATQYLQISDNNLDRALSLYYQDIEPRNNRLIQMNQNHINFSNRADNSIHFPLINNRTISINLRNHANSLFEQLNGSSTFNHLLNLVNTLDNRTLFTYPKNIDELASQLLYRFGENKPHHCQTCDSKAFIRCVKILNLEQSPRDIISMIPQNILEHMKITTDKYTLLGQQIFLIIKDKHIDLVINNLATYILKSYRMRDVITKHNDINVFLVETSYHFGENFRTLWETIHQIYEKKLTDDEKNSEQNEEIHKNIGLLQKLHLETIKKRLTTLLHSEEFISYVNESWADPNYCHPIDKKEINKLETKILNEENIKVHNLEKEFCAICQDNFVADNRKITLLECHVFCTECITPWLEKYNDICPICRKKVCSDDTKKDSEI